MSDPLEEGGTIYRANNSPVRLVDRGRAANERIVQTRNGRCIERDVPGRPGVVERTYIDGGYDIYRPGGTVRIVDRPTAPVRRSRDSAPVEVTFTPGALESIRHTAFWGTGMDGRETGGFLFGINAGGKVLVTRAGGPGSRATRTPGSLEMSSDALARWELDEHVARIGCWHSHPGTREGKPSDYGDSGDLKAWRSGLERINRERWQPFYLGLILTGERSWTRPTVHAWVLDHAGSLERATVKA